MKKQIFIFSFLNLFIVLALTAQNGKFIVKNVNLKAVGTNNIIFKNTDLQTKEGAEISVNESSTFSIDGHLNIDNGAFFNTLGNNIEIILGGNLVNDGNLDLAQNKVIFSNDTADQFISGSSPIDFFNIDVSKAPNIELELTEDITVRNEINMLAGNFRLNQKSIDLLNTGSILNEDENHRVYCVCPSAFIRREVNINAAYNGNPGNLGLEIDANGVAMGNTEIFRRHREGENSSNNPAAVHRKFSVIPELNNGNLDATLTFNYFDNELVAAADANIFTLFRSPDSGVTWERIDGALADPVAKTVTYAGWTQFSDVTVGEEITSTLPVSLTKFNANCGSNKEVQLSWQTASEVNNDYFLIERSSDGENFKSISRVYSLSYNGNSNSILNYNFNDEEVPKGELYYRLTQVDFDGTATVYETKSVNCNEKGGKETFSLIPNPARNHIRVHLQLNNSEKYLMHIIDNKGALVYTEELYLKEGNNSLYYTLENYSPGMYNVNYISESGKYFSQKLVIAGY